jgi:glycosyltransferase involved in cell wall biosynthesis
MRARIAMVAPISHPYPPPSYGPWERVTHDLTEQLVALGHEVTLFAPKGSVTTAHLVETVDMPLAAGHGKPRLEEEKHLAIAMEAVGQGGYDVVHSHLHVHALVFSRLVGPPMLTTLHGAAWDQAHHDLLHRYSEMPYVSISHVERSLLPELNYVATIPNGIRVDEIPMGEGRGGYLAFVGRIAPEKGPDLAIEVALASGLPLHIAGPIEDRHREFFDRTIGSAPAGVAYLGELDREQLWTMLGGALALLMPLRWPEPFGLVAAESLAAGTPVIAWRMGALPEIIDEGVTGRLVRDVTAARHAVEKVDEISREACRRTAETRFSDRVMARHYSAVYSGLLSQTISSRSWDTGTVATRMP